MVIRRLFILIFCIFVLEFSALHIHAQTTSDTDKRIEELKAKVAELQGTANTLTKEITIRNNQIAMISLRIESMRSAISKLTAEADQLAGEIDRIETLLTRRTELVLKRIPESYMRSSASQFGMIFFSRDFNDFIAKVEYISLVQKQDTHLMLQLKATQNNFEERKNLREEKKIEKQTLQTQLEAESLELERTQKEKQHLLDQTRSSEAVYQQLLSQALAERQALERALVEGVQIGPIKKGDPIALVGNTGYPGCSTGQHLHFEVRNNNVWTDPSQYLQNKTVNDEQNGGTWNVGSGSWDWPIADTVRITQHYGKTPYSWRYAYSGGMHTGFDMISTSGDIIRAPSDGTLYSSSQACGSGSIIKIKYIDHGGGLVSFFLHVQ